MYIVGLISGTSVDGIDAALCDISDAVDGTFTLSVIYANTYSYPDNVRNRILQLCTTDPTPVEETCRLNVEIGQAFAEAALRVIADAGYALEHVDIIASHGQTVWHTVEADGHVHSTLQLGEGAVIAEQTGRTVIHNFRARDVAAGGQGAPLASYLDWVRLRHPTRWRAIQNIGGIGNVSFLPPTTDTTHQPLSFDTGPGNILIDSAVHILTEGEHRYDPNGEMARDGHVDDAWLMQLLAHPYYALQPPKTTGRELFSADMAADLVAEGRRRQRTANDILATLTALTAASIAASYHRFAPVQIDEVIVGGGGRNNATLMQMLRDKLSPATVLTSDDMHISSDYKEALLFALLGYQAWHHRPNTIAAMTGAAHDVVMGQITPGANYVSLLQRTWCANN
ncbi:MAG: anhydro-N-acetylmuramic acid kinase [Chloroflexi bacterium]|nr:MAG: anhydro-N-acetylmuramic acid kinase [Chloroflexota bacterium]